MAVQTIKSTCLHLHLYRPFFSAAKSEVVIPSRKFRFVSFSNISRPLLFYLFPKKKNRTPVCILSKVSIQGRSVLCEHFVTRYVLRLGFVSTSPTLQAGGPRLVGCPVCLFNTYTATINSERSCQIQQYFLLSFEVVSEGLQKHLLRSSV